MNRLIIRVLYAITNVIWYLFLVFVVIITIGVCIKMFTSHQLEWDVPVNIDASHLPLTGMNTDQATVGTLRHAEGLMQFKVHLTPFLAANAILFYTAGLFLAGAILYHTRRIFRSLKADIPFNAENVKRLRYIGLFVIGIAFIDFINMLYNNILFKAQLQQAGHLYHIKIVLGCWPIATGLVILVLSEVFRKGYQLKVDNESFV